MQRPFGRFYPRRGIAVTALTGASLIAGLTFLAGPESLAANPKPFKFMNIHFETNASGCDMGIQILFDTDGVTDLTVEDPHDTVVFSSQALPDEEDTHDQTEGFQERVEPPIAELEDALGCDPDPDALSLNEMLSAWPAGNYEFEASSGTDVFEGVRKLTHRIPAGPVISVPQDGAVVSHTQSLLIKWSKVTAPIIPSLGPVTIVGYHALVKDITAPGSGPLAPAQYDIDVAKNETTVVVPAQFLEPNRIYEFEILATEVGGNQTITEGGVFCTPPKTPATCVKP